MLKSFAFLDTTTFENGVKFPLSLTDKYTVHELYKDDFKFKNELLEWETSEYHSTGSRNFIVENNEEFERKDYQKVIYTLNNTISLIRLVKYNRMYFSKMVCFENGRVTMSGSLDSPRPSNFVEDEKLTKTDIRVVQKIINNIKSISSGNQRVLRAFHFLDSSTCSNSFEHKVVDLFISLESLFTVENEETTYRLANRMAWFLNGTNSLVRVTIFDKVKKAYRIRSKVVHGQKFVESEELPLINELHSIARDIILTIFLHKRLLKMFSENDENLPKHFNKLVAGDRYYVRVS